MQQNIQQLKDRQFRALTGLGKKDFNTLAAAFSETHLEIQAAYYKEFEDFYDRKPSLGGCPIFKTPSQKLFMTLFYLKSYPTFDVLGFTFNCSGKTAHDNLYKFLPILEKTLDKLSVLPKRSFQTVEEFIAFTKAHKDLLIDATERIHHRKKDQEEQRKYYNGKKKCIPLKTQ